MRIFNGFEEIKSAVGTEVGVSEWFEITQDRINKFAEATCDEQWIHVDQDRAKLELPGGKTIAHGLLSLSLRSDVHPVGDGAQGAGEYPELWRGPDPLSRPRSGRLTPARTHVRIAEAEEVPPDGLRVNYHLVIEIEGGQRRPALPSSSRCTCAEPVNR